MKDFVSEVRPEVPLPEGLAKKIWDWFIVMGIGTMVRPERSVKQPIDHEAEIKIKVELAMRDYLAENEVLRAELELARVALT
ncbi:hypothetical protein KY285_032812 [Solanum tuberosum]|nr:hypothetical protein KY285_032812 [Solanum tuberosum]